MASISKDDRNAAKDSITAALKLLVDAQDRIGGHPGTQRNPKHANPYMPARIVLQTAMDDCWSALGDLNEMDVEVAP